MIYSPLSFSTRSTEMNQGEAPTVTADGQALVTTVVNGRQVVTPSTGVAGEKFVGFSQAQTSAAPFIPSTAVKVEEVEVDVAGIIVISRDAISGTASAVEVTTGAVVALTAVVGNPREFNAGPANAGKVLRVTFRYTLTVTDARALLGDVQPGGFVGSSYQIIGVSQAGVIYTDHFDTTKDWSSATTINLGANGVLTVGGAGAAIPAVVKAVPGADYPFLGLQFNSAY